MIPPRESKIAYCASRNQSVDVYVPGDAPTLASFHEFSPTTLPRKVLESKRIVPDSDDGQLHGRKTSGQTLEDWVLPLPP